MLFRNVSKETLRPWKGLLAHPVPPDATFEVADGYAMPQRSTGGLRLPSAIEQVYGKRVEPAEPRDKIRWLEVPDKMAPKIQQQNAPTVKRLMAMGFSQGIAEEMVKKHFAEQQAEALKGPGDNSAATAAPQARADAAEEGNDDGDIEDATSLVPPPTAQPAARKRARG